MTTTNTEVLEIALDLAATLEKLTPEDAHEWLDDQLDIEIHGIYRDRMWNVDSIDVLVTYGGPSVRVNWNGTATLTISVIWGSEQVNVRADSGELAAILEEYADIVDAAL